MEQTIDVVVDFVRTQGLYRGAAKDLRKRLGRTCPGPRGDTTGQGLDEVRRRSGEAVASGRATARLQRGDRNVLRQVQVAGARASQGRIHGPALGAGRVRRGADSRGRPRGTRTNQDSRRHRLDQDQAGRDRGIQAPNRLSSLGNGPSPRKPAERRNETGGKSRARACLISNYPVRGTLQPEPPVCTGLGLAQHLVLVFQSVGRVRPASAVPGWPPSLRPPAVRRDRAPGPATVIRADRAASSAPSLGRRGSLWIACLEPGDRQR